MNFDHDPGYNGAMDNNIPSEIVALSSAALKARGLAAERTICRSGICVFGQAAGIIHLLHHGPEHGINLLHVELLEGVARTAQSVIDERAHRRAMAATQ